MNEDCFTAGLRSDTWQPRRPLKQSAGADAGLRYATLTLSLNAGFGLKFRPNGQFAVLVIRKWIHFSDKDMLRMSSFLLSIGRFHLIEIHAK